ncbi:MAG: hypothetical protein V3S06_01425 [candidate division Zixibacteria bacterium]
MKKIIKSKIMVASLLFVLLDMTGGLLIMAPLLVFLRIHFEYTGSAFKLWPVISPEVLSDILINDYQALVMFLIAAIVIFVAYFPLRVFITAGIYNIIIFNREGGDRIDSVRTFLTRSAESWIGFVKAEIFGILIYIVALFLGIVFGGVLGRLGSILRPAVILLLLLLGSTYIQILKIAVVQNKDTSLRSVIRFTRNRIKGSFLRLVLGNVAVALVGLLVVSGFWSLLLWTRSYDWNIVTASISVILQQGAVFFICLAQVLRINFNHSVIKRGE